MQHRQPQQIVNPDTIPLAAYVSRDDTDLTYMSPLDHAESLDRLVSLPGTYHKQLDETAHMLDIGCGTGKLLEALDDRYDASLTGIDQDLETVQAANETHEHTDISLYHADAATYTTDDRYDTVYLINVLQASEDPTAILSNAASLLTDDGITAVTIPPPTGAELFYDAADHDPRVDRQDNDRGTIVTTPTATIRLSDTDIGDHIHAEIDAADIDATVISDQYVLRSDVFTTMYTRAGLELVDEQELVLNPESLRQVAGFLGFRAYEERFDRLTARYKDDPACCMDELPTVGLYVLRRE